MGDAILAEEERVKTLDFGIGCVKSFDWERCCYVVHIEKLGTLAYIQV